MANHTVNGQVFYASKLKSLGVLLATFCLIHVFTWFGRWWPPQPPIIILLAMGWAGEGLTVFLPLLLRRLRPHLAAFELIWIRTGWKHAGWTVVLILASIAWVIGIAFVTPKNEFPLPIFLNPFGEMQIVLVLTAVLFIVVAPIAEEIFWRGYAQDQLQKSMPGWLALFVQAIAFAAAHSYSGVTLAKVFGCGLIFGFWRLRMRTLLPIVLAHVIVNTLITVPKFWTAWQEVGHWVALNKDDPRTRDDIAKWQEQFKRGSESPQGRRINAFARKPTQEAIAGIIPYLGDENEDVRQYASTMLQVRYKNERSQHYMSALDSTNPRLVKEVILFIEIMGWAEYAPRLHELVFTSPEFSVQFYGVFALDAFRDAKSLADISSRHPDERVRLAASRKLKNLTSTSTSASPTSASP